ncbi:MAG TPA: hypothetical protein VGB54_10890 [Allosphingosinicella sp.]|jgi:hypothetical protein
MKRSVSLLLVLSVVGLDIGVALAQASGPRSHLPLRRVGQCAMTRITEIGYRLSDESNRPIRDSGTYFGVGNGLGGVSYSRVAAVHRSRVGDRVRICLVSIPRGCPPGDDRGRAYRTTNLRTRQSWVMGDSQHMCGGA